MRTRRWLRCSKGYDELPLVLLLTGLLPQLGLICAVEPAVVMVGVPDTPIAEEVVGGGCAIVSTARESFTAWYIIFFICNLSS